MILGSLEYGYSFGGTYCIQIQMPFFVGDLPVHTEYEFEERIGREGVVGYVW
jgi:hypothetical protein